MCLVAQLCPTFCHPMDCRPPAFSDHGILQEKILQWVAIPFSGHSSQTRDRTQVSCIAGRFFTIWATRGTHSNQYRLKLSCYLNQSLYFSVYFPPKPFLYFLILDLILFFHKHMFKCSFNKGLCGKKLAYFLYI